MLSVIYAECHYSECRYAECRYAECRYTEYRGARKNNYYSSNKSTKHRICKFYHKEKHANNLNLLQTKITEENLQKLIRTII